MTINHIQTLSWSVANLNDDPPPVMCQPCSADLPDGGWRLHVHTLGGMYIAKCNWPKKHLSERKMM